MTLLYGCIVTPVYEEFLFRGYIWTIFEENTGSRITALIWNVVLFTVWHLGYMIPNIFSGNHSAVIWKLAAGMGYGITLSLIRYKAKNCWATIMVHGVLNLFMV